MQKVFLDQYFEIQKRADSLLLTPKESETAAFSTALRVLGECALDPLLEGLPPIVEHHVLLNLAPIKTIQPQQLRPLMELQQAMSPSLHKLILFGGLALANRATLRTAGVERAIAYFAQETEALESIGLKDTPIEELSLAPEDVDLVVLSEALTPFVAAVCDVMKKTLSVEAQAEEAFPKLLTGRTLISIVGIRTPVEFAGFVGEYTLSLPKKTLQKLAEVRGVPMTDLEDAKILETLIGTLASSAFVLGRDALKKQGVKLLKAPVLSILPPSKYALYDERVIPRVLRPFSTPQGDFVIEIYNRGASGAVFPG